ncbi:unnamed protein product [Tilletia caries]|nr:unnamed protein product [Tilletia caries]CAD6927935.1 unnamed protein product [Tilletia controversa]
MPTPTPAALDCPTKTLHRAKQAHPQQPPHQGPTQHKAIRQSPGVESSPFRIKDGDVIQLGVDYQGGTEEIYRCVKMRIELNRGCVNALRQLRALQGSPMPGTPSGNETDKMLNADAAPGATVSAVAQPPAKVTDCCIYLEADVEDEDEDEKWQADLMRQATQGVDGAGTTSSAPVASAPVVSAEPMSAQQTLAPGLAGPGTTSAAHPLATVQEVHSRQSSAIPSQAGDLLTRSGDSGMALDQAARGSAPTRTDRTT